MYADEVCLVIDNAKSFKMLFGCLYFVDGQIA